MSKRILSLVLTLALVLGSFSMAFAAPTDVVGTDVEDAVERLGNLGILTGYTDGTFKPENNITRAEFAAVVSRARGLEQAAINSKGNTAFGDVPASHWASGYINVSDKAGLVKGMGKVNGVNTFGPELNITYEQAVTLVVRALGYEPAAQANGGYPTGHLVVASQEGLLDGVKGSVGQLASRGLVAQLTDNALEVAKMIQVGYGDQQKFVKSGTEGTTEQFLFNDLQLTKVEGQLESESSKNKITVANKSLIVTDKNFDYAGLDGLKVQVWYNKEDKVISVKKLSDYTVMFDAVKIDTAKKELTTVTEDKDYDFIEDTNKVVVKGEESKYSSLDTEYSFAKIVLNEYGDVTWIEVYNLTEMVVVSEVKGNDVIGYNSDEIADANDYTIVKDGKQVPFTSLKEKDVVLYNSGKEYAAVVTSTKKGKIDTVYTNSFKFEGKNYDNASIKYISGNDLETINEDVLKEMKDNGEVEVFFNFNNKPVVINGVVEEVVSNYVILTSDSVAYNERGKKYVTFDYMNAEGTKVKETLDIESNNNIDEDIVKSKVKVNDFITRDDTSSFGALTNNVPAMKASKGKIFKVSLDSKGKLSGIEAATVANQNVAKDFKLDASYVNGFKLQNNTTIFWNDATDAKATDYKDYKVATIEEAKKSFNEVKFQTADGSAVPSTISVDKDGKIVAVVAVKTDVEDNGIWVTGIVKDVRLTSNDYYVTLEVNGVEKEYRGKKDDLGTLSSSDENKVMDLKVTEDGFAKAKQLNLGTSVKLSEAATGSTLKTVSNGDLVVEGKYYEFTNGEFKKVNTSDFKKNEIVTVYFREGSNKFVQVVAKGAGTGNVSTDGRVTYINPSAGSTPAAIAIEVTDANNNFTEYVRADGDMSLAVATFLDTNRTILNGAKVGFDLDTNGNIRAIKTIELAANYATTDLTITTDSAVAGVVIDGNGKTLRDITVQGDNVKIMNLTMNDLTVAGDNFTSKENTVNGNVLVTGNNANFNTTINGNVVVNGTATFTNVTFAAGTVITGTGDVTIAGTVGNLVPTNIQNTGNKVTGSGVEAAEAVAVAVTKIGTYNADADAMTIVELKATGVKDVVVDNLAAYKIAVKGAGVVTSVADVQARIDAGNAAVNVIKAKAIVNASDTTLVEINKVDANATNANLAVYQAAIAASSETDVDTAVKIAKLVSDSDAVVLEAAKYETTATIPASVVAGTNITNSVVKLTGVNVADSSITATVTAVDGDGLLTLTSGVVTLTSQIASEGLDNETSATITLKKGNAIKTVTVTVTVTKQA